jgi:hypothetical protein
MASQVNRFTQRSTPTKRPGQRTNAEDGKPPGLLDKEFSQSIRADQACQETSMSLIEPLVQPSWYREIPT